MKKILLLGVLLATGGCQGMHQRLSMRREEGDTASDAHHTWFESFVDAVDNEEEEWDTIEKVLEEGKTKEQFSKTVTWPKGERGCEYTPLHYAATRGNLEVVRELINSMEVPVGIRTCDSKSTPLHLAASQGHLDIVKFLVKNDADIAATDSEESNALHYATTGGQGENNRDVIEYLVENGADFKKPAKTGTSLLGLAVFASNIPVIEYWIDKFSNDSDPKIKEMTERALKIARHLKKKGHKTQAHIIRMLEESLKPGSN